jgi:ADP-heptose:LPS heptosyltransferase
VSSGAALAIHPGALGDVLLTIPALRALRVEGRRLTLAAQPHIAALIVALGEADEARDFESLRLDALFAGEGAPRLPAAERVVCWFGARDPDFARRLSALAPGAVVAASTSLDGLVWEHLLATVGGAADRQPARVSDDLIARGLAALSAAGVDLSRRFVVVHPGAGSVAKRWSPDAFAAVLGSLRDVAIVVHEGPADAEPVARLLERVPSAHRLLHPDLPALAGVLAHSAVYLGNDSGVSHLAAVVGVRCVLLFADESLVWVPWPRKAMVVPVDVNSLHADVARVSDLLEGLLR